MTVPKRPSPHHRPEHLPAVLADLPLPRDHTDASIPGSDLHQQAVIEAYGMLQDYAAVLGGAAAPAWYVSSQVLVTAQLWGAVWRHRPDLFVVPGIPATPRATYDIMKDGPVPPFVLEVTGPRTWHDDTSVKPAWYDVLGVQEYLVFDPTRQHLGAAMRGWHVTGDGWVEWLPVRSAGGAEVWPSAVLGLVVRPDGPLVRFDHAQRGPLPTRRELREHLEQEQRRRADLEEELLRRRT